MAKRSDQHRVNGSEADAALDEFISTSGVVCRTAGGAIARLKAHDPLSYEIMLKGWVERGLRGTPLAKLMKLRGHSHVTGAMISNWFKNENHLPEKGASDG